MQLVREADPEAMRRCREDIAIEARLDSRLNKPSR